MNAETRAAYRETDNALAKAEQLKMRDAGASLPDAGGEFENWIGTFEGLNAASDGKYMLFIRLSEYVTLETNKGSDAEAVELTMIDKGSALQPQLASLKEGDLVRIWGRVLREGSVSEQGKMNAPEYVTKFYWVEHATAEAESQSDYAESRAAMIGTARAEYEAKVAHAKDLENSKSVACKSSASCIGATISAEAEGPCKRLIEASVKYDVKWTGGWLDSLFTRAKWVDQKGELIMLLGDSAQFQNGFGNYIRGRYVCVYDIRAKKPISVDMEPGRLP